MPCLCCRPDCGDCFPDLWMAAVNADFEANAERYMREYDEADAAPLSQADMDRMMARTWELIEESERSNAERKRIASGN